jgi:hypothetical protein
MQTNHVVETDHINRQKLHWTLAKTPLKVPPANLLAQTMKLFPVFAKHPVTLKKNRPCFVALIVKTGNQKTARIKTIQATNL